MSLSVGKDLIRRIRAELARESILAAGRTAPNPAVAAVVLGRTPGASELRLFAGGTEPPGGRHAEIVALDRCRAAGATPRKIYVSLEPCAHFGRTPPCADRILAESELERIVVFQRDPGAGAGGVERLREAGRRVRIAGGRAAASFDFLDGFLDRIRGAGPRYHLKFALSADGFMAGAGSERLQISGPRARRFVMALRSRADAVLVGPGTVAGDRPGLELRAAAEGAVCSWPADPPTKAPESASAWVDALLAYLPQLETQAADAHFQPDRVFILGRAFPEQNAFFEKQARLAVLTGRSPVYLTTPAWSAEWSTRGAILLPEWKDPAFPRALRELLGDHGYNEVLIEGGPRLLDTIAPDLRARDLGYVLRSKVLRAGAGRPGPRLDWEGEPRRFDLGEDLLECGRLAAG